MTTLKVEIRGEIDKDIIDVVDGVVHARRGSSRTEIISEILRQWADEKIHEATIILRVAGINPIEPESRRK